MKYHFFPRAAEGTNPVGWTVSKHATLPRGDFQIDEFEWGPCSLWFITADAFSADERQEAYLEFVIHVADHYEIADQHLLRLIQSESKGDGWAKVSDIVWPVIQDLPRDLVETSVHDGVKVCRLTEAGEIILDWT